MPRRARLDAPGTLHHIIVRGIERRQIVDDDRDRRDFVSRMGTLAVGILGEAPDLFDLDVIGDFP